MRGTEGQEPEERAPIWSVSISWVSVYWPLFAFQMLVYTALIAWLEIGINTDDSGIETIVAIGKGSGSLVLFAAALPIAIREVWYIMLERLSKGRREIYRDEGRKEGQRQERREWESWNARREQYEKENPGQSFPESPPSK